MTFLELRIKYCRHWWTIADFLKVGEADITNWDNGAPIPKCYHEELAFLFKGELPDGYDAVKLTPDKVKNLWSIFFTPYKHYDYYAAHMAVLCHGPINPKTKRRWSPEDFVYYDFVSAEEVKRFYEQKGLPIVDYNHWMNSDFTEPKCKPKRKRKSKLKTQPQQLTLF